MEIFIIVIVVASSSYLVGYKRGLMEAEELVRQALWRASKRLSASAFNELTNSTKLGAKK